MLILLPISDLLIIVKISIAGGSGEVAREVISVLVAANKHDITILSRKDISTLNSEFHRAGKDETKDYLKRVNENGKVLEYCLFQPGLFVNYLATPHKTAEYVTPLNTFVDLQNRHAIVVNGHNPIVTFTTVQDMAAVVARAVDFEGVWPVVGGIRGNHLAVSEIIKIGESIRGGPFSVDAVKLEDLEAGKLTVPSTIKARHSSVMGMSEEQVEAMAKSVLVGVLLSSAKRAWEVSDESLYKRLQDWKKNNGS
ncbi:Isoflavone reductase IRL [Madurella fahalii]|uniref:Isoflavone reductase IRL n=1 Tax=Madurella fahalii TaxID=1157608 RepID=A0ABQ0GJG6_9PEZI